MSYGMTKWKKDYRVHLTLKSSNRKTGPIPVSTTEMSTCPKTCPLRKDKEGGCYAEGGPLFYHWLKVSDGTRAMSWGDFCKKISELPKGQLWRHNQAGDLPGDGHVVDPKAVEDLVKANKGRRGFTYTHYDIKDPVNYGVISYAVKHGFVINLSANDLGEADDLCEVVSKKYPPIPVTSVIHGNLAGNYPLRTPKGRKVVVCPASYRDDISCEKCQLCAMSEIKHKDGTTEERPIIGFPAHGRSAKRINIRLEKYSKEVPHEDNTQSM